MPAAAGSYDNLYLSPHLDDGVFSCGGMMATGAARGERSLMVTVFSGAVGSGKVVQPPADEGALSLAPFLDMDARRQEDTAAARALGVDVRWLGWDEAPLRHRGYRQRFGLFVGIKPSDAALQQQLTEAVADLITEVRPRRLFAPLNVANHVDHELVFRAAAAGVKLAAAAGRQAALLYYEDAPYAYIHGTVQRRLLQLRLSVPRQLRARTGFSVSVRRSLADVLALDIVSTRTGTVLRACLRAALYVVHIQLRLRTLLSARKRRPNVRTLSGAAGAAARKHAARAAYASQLAGVLGTNDCLDAAMRRYCQLSLRGSRLAERFWCHSDTDTEFDVEQMIQLLG